MSQGLRTKTSSDQTTSYSQITIALLFSLLWSSAFIAGKIGVQVCPPLFLLSFRFLIAGPLMLLFANALGFKTSITRNELMWLSILGLLNNTLYLGLTFTGLKTVPSGLVVVLVSTAPIITSLIAKVILHENLSYSSIAGLILGFLGVIIIMAHSLTDVAIDPFGLVLTFLGTIAFSLGTVLFKRAPLNSLGLFSTVGYQTLVGGITLLIFAFYLEDQKLITLNLIFFEVLAYLTFVVSIAATMLWFALVRSTTASNASAFHYLNPAFGVLLAWTILGESFSAYNAVGTILVILGIIIVTRLRN